jgi:hypothetical protein
MTINEIIAAVGVGCPRWELVNMKRALSMHVWLNDDTEKVRLRACREALDDYRSYVRASNAYRNLRPALRRA